MTTLDRIEEFLKKNPGETLPEIKYFNGTEKFSDITGCYAAKTLEESILLFITDYERRNKNNRLLD